MVKSIQINEVFAVFILQWQNMDNCHVSRETTHFQVESLIRF